jgi:hypothetical protein
MKSKSKLFVALALIAASFATGANAQESVIKALVKKCETMESVDVNTIRSRDRETKELTRELVSISIKSNPALVKEFQDAFQEAYQKEFSKSKDAADQEVVTRRGGKIVNLVYRFGDVSYHFSVENEGNASVSISNNPGGGKRIDRARNRLNDIQPDGFATLPDAFEILPDAFSDLNFDLSLFLQIPDMEFEAFEYFEPFF